MTTPILTFVRNYLASRPHRLHMPGHKGVGPLGCEALDITEIDGAGSLYAAAESPIAESEAIASRLFGMPTWYSAEGSSLALRAMLRLALSRDPAPRPVVLAGRNAHAAFMSAAALLGFDVEWLLPRSGATCHSCPVGPEDVDAALERLGGRCRTVFVTSPDYLGHTLDLAALAAACHRRGALLLVDNAHGAYLKFLTPSRHPVDLGADLCCDSAHKTLPALTGGAYLHASPALDLDSGEVKRALMLFGSTSPSWLILQSLDACNPYLQTLPQRLSDFLPKLDALKAALTAHGYTLVGDEPMKLTIDARPLGTTGDALAEYLAAHGITCELHDPDYLVLMPTPQNTDADLDALRDALLAFAPSPKAFPFSAPRLSLRSAAGFGPSVPRSIRRIDRRQFRLRRNRRTKFAALQPVCRGLSPFGALMGEGGSASALTDEVAVPSKAFPYGEGGAARSAVTDEVPLPSKAFPSGEGGAARSAVTDEVPVLPAASPSEKATAPTIAPPPKAFPSGEGGPHSGSDEVPVLPAASPSEKATAPAIAPPPKAFPSGASSARKTAQCAVFSEAGPAGPWTGGPRSGSDEVSLPPRAMTIRQAALAPRETLPADQCVGRILAAPALSCPPCVPLATCGERLTPAVLQSLRYYGIETCEVVLENEE